MNNIDLAERLRALRTRKGYTLLMVAEATGLSEAYISMLETGIRVPSLSTLQALAKVFGVKPGKLLEG